MKWMGGVRRRITVTFVSVLLLFTATISGGAIWIIREKIFNIAFDDIRRDGRIFTANTRDWVSEHLIQAKLLAQDVKVISALGTPDLDQSTIQDIAGNILNQSDMDLVILWDMDRKILGFAMREGKPDSEGFHRVKTPGPDGAYLVINNQVIHAVSAEVTNAGAPVGFVTVGDLMNDISLTQHASAFESENLLLVTKFSDSQRVCSAKSSNLDPADFPAVYRWLDLNPAAPGRLKLSATGDNYLAFSVPLTTEIHMVFMKSMEHAEKAAATMTIWAIAIAGGFLLISTVLFGAVSGAITRPIEGLIASSHSFSRGNFDARADETKGPTEIRLLGSSFNQMAEKLKEFLCREAEAKDILEKEIQRRTEELRKSQEELARAERLASIGTLAAGVAHELNNPLTGVMGYAQMLMSEVTDPQARQDAENILRESKRCADIVKNLLRFARQKEPVRAPAKIHQSLDAALKLTAVGSMNKDIAIVKEYDPAIPEMLLDDNQIQQVFVNIAQNAFHAISAANRKGVLTVRTRLLENRVRVQFTDNGQGIPQESASKIFDPFFTTKEVGQGTGLGLSVSLGIVQQHGGRIYVEDTGPTGTTLVVELPLVEPAEPEMPDTNRPGAAEPVPSMRGRRALVVDDEDAARLVMNRLLSKCGYRVFPAAGAREALNLIESEKTFDVVFSDIRMPGMDGMEFYKRLKEQSPELAGRVVFVTGDTLSEDIRRFLDTTGRPSINKPFRMDELMSAAASVIQKG